MQPVPQVQMQSATVSARQGIRVMPQRRVVHVRPVHVVRLSLVLVIRHVQQRQVVIMHLVLGTLARPRQPRVIMRRPARVHRPHVVAVSTVPRVHHRAATSVRVAMVPVRQQHVRILVPRGIIPQVVRRHVLHVQRGRMVRQLG